MLSRAGRKTMIQGPVCPVRTFLFLAFLAAAILSAPAPSWAYFQDLGMGARPIGMGDAFTAVADDSNTLLFNPAGLPTLEYPELNAAYSNLYTNLGARLFSGNKDTLGFHNLGLVVPLEREIGSFGAYWSLFSSEIYRENTFVLAYGREVGPEIFRLFKAADTFPGVKLDVGLKAKVLNWQVIANEFTDANSALRNTDLGRTGFTADLGFLVRTADHVSAGVTLENLIPTNVGVTVYETVPFGIRLGGAYLYDWQGRAAYLDSLLGALDLVHRNGINDVRAGAEAWFAKHLFAVRMGTTLDEITTGASFFTPIKTRFDMRLDYAFTYPYAIKDTWGSHRISMILRWDPNPEKPAPQEAPTALQVEPDNNLAEERDRELGIERAREEARLKELNAKLSAQVQAAREELAKLQELINLGKIPSIQFESGKAILTEASFKTLNEVGRVLEKYPQIKTRLEGNTDSLGKAATNQRLSLQRVEAVKAYLQGRFHITPTNLITVGYGSSRPLATNATAEGRAANRRVEFKVLIPAGLVSAASGTPAAAGQLSGEGQVRAEDVVSYEELENLRDKLKVYQMQMNPKEVEQMFEEQHKQNGVTTDERTTPVAQPGAQPTPGGKTK